MMNRFLFLIVSLVLLASAVDALLASTEEQEFEVIPNPYQEHNNDEDVCFSNLDNFLEPYHLLTKPLQTQPDTFQELSYAKVLTVPVPIYRMKQPARLSPRQLEFQLVLVRDLSSTGKASNIQAVTVDPAASHDSWFPGYYWSPLALYCPESNDYQHVGWKFTALDDAAELPHFYALMIQMDDRSKEGVQIRIGGFKAPGWIAARVTL